MGGVVLMVLEVVGARSLLKDFGGSFYVWISQIGVIMIALALGYYAGGALVDTTGRMVVLAWMLIAAGVYTLLVPELSPMVLDWIVMRHPLDQEIPPVWQKLDPALGSALVFLWPCVTLAMLSPCMVRISAVRLSWVGRTSGLVSSVSSAGNIAGVFIAGYVLLDRIAISGIFRIAGILVIVIGIACMAMDQWLARPRERSGDA
jgi:predicted MFS family arabinose efflux permease